MPKKAKPDLDALMERCLVFVDRNGEVLDKGGNPVNAWLKMRYRGQGLKISMRVQCSPHSNGSCSITVREGKKLVFEAHGNYTASPFNVEATTYAPGDWETKIPQQEKKGRG